MTLDDIQKRIHQGLLFVIESQKHIQVINIIFSKLKNNINKLDDREIISIIDDILKHTSLYNDDMQTMKTVLNPILGISSVNFEFIFPFKKKIKCIQEKILEYNGCFCFYFNDRGEYVQKNMEHFIKNENFILHLEECVKSISQTTDTLFYIRTSLFDEYNRLKKPFE